MNERSAIVWADLETLTLMFQKHFRLSSSLFTLFCTWMTFSNIAHYGHEMSNVHQCHLYKFVISVFVINIDPMPLFLSYTNMNCLHHVKEHPKISNFLQFESHSSKSFFNLHDWFLGRKYWYHSNDPVQISISVQFQHCTWTSWWIIGT